MDFVNGGELFSHLQKDKKFPEPRVKFYAAEIALGLEYLHNSGVIYRDLKPENILITEDGHICMTDFGISKQGLIVRSFAPDVVFRCRSPRPSACTLRCLRCND